MTSLSSEFSLITEEAGGASSLTNDTVDLFSSQPQASSWLVLHTQAHGGSSYFISMFKYEPFQTGEYMYKHIGYMAK